MIVDCLPKPSSLAGTVECEARSPSSVIQINRYSWNEPREAVFKPETPIIDIVLSRRRASLDCSFLELSRPESRRVGDILFMPPGYTLHSRWDRGDRRSMCCVFDPASVSDLFDFDWGDRKLFASLNIDNAVIRGTMMRLVYETLEPQFASALLIESLCTALAVELRRHFDILDNEDVPLEGEGGLSPNQLRRIRESLEDEDASNPTTVAQLARDEGMSVRHFSRLFRASTGTTVSDYAAQIRIERAMRLLCEERLLIKEIAFRCGFQSSSSFSSAFRRATSLTPQQYRVAQLN